MASAYGGDATGPSDCDLCRRLAGPTSTVYDEKGPVTRACGACFDALQRLAPGAFRRPVPVSIAEGPAWWWET